MTTSGQNVRLWILSSAAVVCVLILGLSGTSANQDAVETGRLLAILLDSGRVTVGANQELINDGTKGSKDFTPEVFEQQLLTVFKERTGIDLTDLPHSTAPTMANPLLARLLEESKKTIASYQVVINMQGIKYKGLIPATFGTETAARFQSWSGVYLKQTAPSQIIRNLKNKPDQYETSAFQRFADPNFIRQRDGVISDVVEDGKSLRVMLPLFYRKACLSCHGEPKGERDISGYPREGAKEGDLGGAISVKLPLP